MVVNKIVIHFFQNSHVECSRRQTNEVARALANVSPYLAISHIFSQCIVMYLRFDC